MITATPPSQRAGHGEPYWAASRVDADQPPDATVLVVDDEAALRRILVRILTSAGYHCRTADSAAAARQVLAAEPVDLLLCDVNMPGENGFGLLRHVAETTPHVGVIMVTAVADALAAQPVAQYGALGYVVKPFEASEILINVAAALAARRRDLAVARESGRLAAAVTAKTDALSAAVAKLALSEQTVAALHEETVLRLATVAEWRDPCTGQHLRSMSDLSASLATAAGLPSTQVDLVRVASLLHDVGKVAIPDSVLLKPGPLTRNERAIMQEHAAAGAAMLEGSTMEVLRIGALIAHTHHERWDGNGYPRGLKGLKIPVESRVVAIADVFDALSSERPYKPAWSHDRVLTTMLAGRGSQFDPDLLDLFVDTVIQ